MNINKIIKRNGELQEFNELKIVEAIKAACRETEYDNDINVIHRIAKEIKEENALHFEHQGQWLSIENISDMAEVKMQENGMYAEAKRYILFRSEAQKIRDTWKFHKKLNYLSNEFLKPYVKRANPFKTQIAKVVFYRTYSRFIASLNRRENWLEMNARIVEYIMELDPNGSIEKAEELFDYMFDFKVFSSGRIRYTGGTESIKRNFQSAFSCSYVAIDTVDYFSEVLYLLTIGSGVGYSLYKEDVAKIEALRQNIKLINKNYKPVDKHKRQELTTTNFNNNNILEIVVGDSKTGWAQAVQIYFDILKNRNISSSDNIVKTILLNYDNVRPKGEPLKTFGGYASGHIPFMNAMTKIHDVILNSEGTKLSRNRVKLESIDITDIMGNIALAIVSGGVRRSSLIGLIDSDDFKVKHAKDKISTLINGKWITDKNLIHRRMSNNTIMYREKPSRKELHDHIDIMKISGEPGFANLQELQRRKPDAKGMNPCSEILLKTRQHCNLTQLNMVAFVNEDGSININEIYKALYWATYIAFVISMQELDLYAWDDVARDDRIIGISMTGWQDFNNLAKLTIEQKIDLLKGMREIAHKANETFAAMYNTTKAELVTSMQPAGTVSILPDSVSSGFHFSHSPYYIRRVRINAEDPISQTLVDSGFTWDPEVGQTIEDHNTKVFSFPVKAPEGRTKYDVSAIEQLEEYKLLMENFVDHNVSSTIHVRPNEWDDVEQWLWDNWDCMVGISFLSLDDSFYELLPYEAINKDKYNKLLLESPSFNPDFLSKYEDGSDFEIDDKGGCEQGYCPIR